MCSTVYKATYTTGAFYSVACCCLGKTTQKLVMSLHLIYLDVESSNSRRDQQIWYLHNELTTKSESSKGLITWASSYRSHRPDDMGWAQLGYYTQHALFQVVERWKRQLYIAGIVGTILRNLLRA